ncbi:hypothetical protein C8R44DRAFT_744185 [Mycena epipterygia]|nr:hypothetical protein C8R44DRAFT_744185 [Mycena epipterygia]
MHRAVNTITPPTALSNGWDPALGSGFIPYGHCFLQPPIPFRYVMLLYVGNSNITTSVSAEAAEEAAGSCGNSTFSSDYKVAFTQREIFSKSALDFLGFIMYSSCKGVHLRRMADQIRLRLRNDINYPVQIVQDYIDSSVITDWLRHLCHHNDGRRPLSALGIVHWCQRDALMRQWSEDFPTLHKEGGRPGSESAGIVAFIRERLVDLDDEDTEIEELESRMTTADIP